MNKFALAGLSILATFLGACATPDPIIFHTLRVQPSPAVIPETTTQSKSIIALRNLTLPGYIDESNIVYLQGNNQVVYAEKQKWAEPLTDNLRNVIVEELRNLTASPGVLAYPLANNIRPGKIIDIQIGDFAARKDDKQLLLKASWQITQPGKSSTPPGYQLARQYPLKNEEIGVLMQGYEQAITDLVAAIAKTL